MSSAGLALLTAVALVLTLPGAVVAQSTDPTEAQYDPRAVSVDVGGDPGSGNDTGLGGRVVDQLPFTGFDVMAMAAVALGLTALGLWLQRVVARQRRDLESP